MMAPVTVSEVVVLAEDELGITKAPLRNQGF